MLGIEERQDQAVFQLSPEDCRALAMLPAELVSMSRNLKLTPTSTLMVAQFNSCYVFLALLLNSGPIFAGECDCLWHDV